jgi:soluble lytic murein transglycosylase-like protein
MSETLVLEGGAQGERDVLAGGDVSALDWRTLGWRATRAMVAATIGGSLAVLLAPSLPAKHGALRAKVHHHRPGLTRAHEPERVETDDQESLAEEVAAAETRARLFTAVSRCRPSLTRAQRSRIAEAIQQEAERHGYDPLFVMAMVEVESTCSPTANSPRGAVGLTQIKPSTARAIAKDLGVPWQGRSTLVHPVLNVRLGLGYLAQLEEQFGDPYMAMAAYNLGPGRVSSMTKHHARRSRYVRKVLARYEGLLEEHAA